MVEVISCPVVVRYVHVISFVNDVSNHPCQSMIIFLETLSISIPSWHFNAQVRSPGCSC